MVLFGIPMIVFLVFGIPMLGFYMLRKNQKKIYGDDETAQRRAVLKYAFLYSGYKKEKYFWEVCVVTRKIFVIFISVFFSGQEIVQAIVGVLLVVVGKLSEFSS